MKSFFSMYRFKRDFGAQAGQKARIACQRNAGTNKGFTLIELMIVVAIVAILTAIAYPSYTHYIIKTRRSAAKACLSEYANYMERYYTTNLTYTGAVNQVFDCESTAQTGNYYTWSDPTIPAGGAAYTLSAVPITATQNDTECGTLSLDQTGKRSAIGGTLGSASCW